MNQDSLESNIKKIYWLKFFSLFLLLMPVMIPFFQDLNIDMKGVYLLQSTFGITVFLFEIPSGYISDLLGRKKTLVVSSILRGIGFSLFPLADSLELLIVAEVILGLSVSLNSGSDIAMVYDTLEVTKIKEAPAKILGKLISYFTLGEGLASLLGSLLLLATLTVYDLAVISAFVSWIPFFITITLIEPPRKKLEQSHKENFSFIFSSLFKHSRLLNLVILNSIMTFTGTLLAVWMYQKYWQDLKIPLVYFGFLWASTNFTVSVFSRTAHGLEKKYGGYFLLVFIGLLPVVGYLGISLVDHVWGVLFCLLFQVTRGIGSVIFKDALNKRVTGEFRATANSVIQMGVRIFFALVGPLFGWLIDFKNLSFATFCASIFYIFVFFLIVIPLLKEKENFQSS